MQVTIVVTLHRDLNPGFALPPEKRPSWSCRESARTEEKKKRAVPYPGHLECGYYYATSSLSLRALLLSSGAPPKSEAGVGSSPWASSCLFDRPVLPLQMLGTFPSSAAAAVLRSGPTPSIGLVQARPHPSSGCLGAATIFHYTDC